MPHIGAPELILVLALALIIFGPGKLPDLGKAVGKTIKEFRRSSNEIMNDVETVASGDKKEEQQLIKAAKS
ncbi:Sec-independent protein translocase protein TatAd [Pelotomaculum schinkii]|uniref:Sec-independent protein translocase protein TatA n=1 Tax=Pelotomaculum schinkii TaxID=78350 RepID=A0A4Y7R8B2_9FIRM|nr:twin-arginine translocase TatA/TatE family subunit [Pelotomaculum schinkii]TEB05208.1 Sec-independent protein translocase protein TatAd [Pelotomaculum schinkii]